MEAKLVVVGGKANKAAVALNLPTIIGRSRDAGLTIAHPMVSRQHCELSEQDGLLISRHGLDQRHPSDGRKVDVAPLLPGRAVYRWAAHFPRRLCLRRRPRIGADAEVPRRRTRGSGRRRRTLDFLEAEEAAEPAAEEAEEPEPEEAVGLVAEELEEPAVEEIEMRSQKTRKRRTSS